VHVAQLSASGGRVKLTVPANGVVAVSS
jgi:hypothetical protein